MIHILDPCSVEVCSLEAHSLEPQVPTRQLWIPQTIDKVLVTLSVEAQSPVLI